MRKLSATVIDRRLNGRDKSIANRQKFLRRIREQIKEQLPEIIAETNIADLGKKGGSVKIKRKLISEPTFREASITEGGVRDIFLPGNNEYVVGDVIEKEHLYGSGNEGSGAGEGDEEIDAVLQREELMKYIFDGMELPDMVQRELSRVTEKLYRHAGFVMDGAPNKLHVVRSFKQSLARKIPMQAAREEELAQLETRLEEPNLTDEERAMILERIEELRASTIPMFDPLDLRYRASEAYFVPTTHATMIMIMDVSGSMGAHEKAVAKRFFYLLYRFLELNYEQVDMVFIMHTSEAHRVSEQEFFAAGRTGGTTVSSALDLAADIIKDELLGKTNIYVAQVSDGDNDDTDNGTCREILEDDIMPFVQYYAYVQVDDYHTEASPGNMSLSSMVNYGKGLWDAYETVAKAFKNFQMRRVNEIADIFPVFKELFKKREHTTK